MKHLITIIALMLMAVRPARADERKDRAKAAVEAGLAAQAAGHYDEAIARYQEAYDAVPHPEILFDLAQAYRLAGKLQTARDDYERYLAIDPDGRVSKDAAHWVAELDAQLAADRHEPAVQDERPAPPPPPVPEPPPAPSTPIAPPPPRAPRSHSHRGTVLVLAASTSAATIAASLVVGQLARTRLDEARALCPDGTCASDADTSRAKALLAQSRLRGNVATGLVAAGAVGLTATAIVWWSERERSPVVPVVTGSQLGVSWTGRF
jgi:iron complex outermembrane receptor protein